MLLAKRKNKLMIFFGVVLLLGLLYFLFVYYVVTNGFRNYQTFCSGYIPLIENYKAGHGAYPANITGFEKPTFSWRYDVNDCNYIADPDGFSFQVASGLIGTAIYMSNEKRWRYD